jgi:signal transduction histidine kinase
MAASRVELEHPRLLPAMLVPDPDAEGRPKRTTRDWIVDVSAFVLAVAIGGGMFLLEANTSGESDALLFWDWLFGSLACLAIWFRRRWPLGVALALVPIGAFSAMSVGAGSIALFTVAVHRRLAIAAAVGALGVALSPIYSLLHDDGSSPIWVGVVIGALASTALVAWGSFVRARRQLVLSLRERAERAENEQQLRVEQARQHERARIAREMHDVLAHRISLLSLHAGALEFRPDASPEEVARAAGVIRGSAHQALEDLRAVIGVLREETEGDAPEPPQPTLADLSALVAESRAAGMNVTLAFHVPADAAVPAALGRNAYRLVQEGLTNAHKHAQGAAVEVTVSGEPGAGLSVEVRSRLPIGSAVGSSEIPGAGTGLVGLSERVALAGGRLEFGPIAGDFRLFGWFPWAV